ncbi:MAG: hypothetical protein E6G94_12180 [Alphaproteobacteria bacterium]|nr:MAG: hypothetical protein E6G94_12180 [Alphaproteobacteria bacterium]
MNIRVRLLALLLLAWGSPALADMTATYVAQKVAMKMTIEIASNGDVRGGTSSPTAYFIVHDGHAYVIQASFDGPVVMRMEDMAAVMTEQMKRMMPNLPADAAKNMPEWKLVKGPAVTIRGRQGVAYYMGGLPKNSPTESPMLVISTDPALAPLAAAMEHQFAMSTGMMGQMLGGSNPMSGLEAVLKTGAPLVLTGMELDSVTTDPIPPSRFALPAEPATIEVVRKTLGLSPS